LSEVPTETRYATGDCLSSAVTAFEKHKIYNKEAIAKAVLSQSLVSQDKARDAVVPAQPAVSLANQGQDIVARFQSELVNGEAKAALHSKKLKTFWSIFGRKHAIAAISAMGSKPIHASAKFR